MSALKQLLVVANRPSPNTQKLAAAVVSGASHDSIEHVSVTFRDPLAATAADVLACQGIILGTTENFGYMSGLMKDFFERIYYPCLEHTQGLPYALYVKAGNDGQGTKVAVERIITGLRWSAVQPTLILKGDFNDHFTTECEELGMLMAAGLDAGIY